MQFKQSREGVDSLVTLCLHLLIHAFEAPSIKNQYGSSNANNMRGARTNSMASFSSKKTAESAESSVNQIAEIVYTMLPLVKSKKAQLLLLILLHRHKDTLLQVQFRRKIPKLLERCFVPEIIDEVCGLYHLLKDIFQFICDENRLEFMVHDMCKMVQLIQKCTRVTQGGVDQFGCEITANERKTLVPGLFTNMFKVWSVQSEAIMDDWKYLPVREIVDFCIDRFIKIVLPDRTGANSG